MIAALLLIAIAAPGAHAADPVADPARATVRGLLGGPTAECAINVPLGGSGSCAATFSLSGAINFVAYVASHNVAGHASATRITWYDSAGIVYDEACTNVIAEGVLEFALYIPPVSSCVTTVDRGYYFPGSQVMIAEATSVTCADPMCSWAGVFWT